MEEDHRGIGPAAAALDAAPTDAAPIKASAIKASAIAPCGIDCALCSGFRRKKDPCSGCNGSGFKPNYCLACTIKFCPRRREQNIEYCIDCAEFPCGVLKRLEKRYRLQYGVNIYENMELIRDSGIDALLEQETRWWTCSGCGSLLCVHKRACLRCGEKNPHYIGTPASRAKYERERR